MIWKKLHDHAIESEHGYVILRATANGKPTGRYITMLGRTANGKVPAVLGGHDSAEEAKAHCEDHFASTRAAVA